MKTIFTILSILFITLTYGQTLEWVNNYGGKEWDSGLAIAIDQAGNTYTASQINDTVDIATTSINTTFISNGDSDILIEKYNTNGELQWVKQIGGTGYDLPNGITVDSDNNVIVVGLFSTTVDFDPGAGTSNITVSTSGTENGFILKLNTNGDFVWVKTYTGTSNSAVLNVVTDDNNNIYPFGQFFETTDFDPGTGVYNFSSLNNLQDVFISKLDANGDFIWAITEGGDYFERAKEIKIKNNFIYVCGEFQSVADFDPTTAVQNFTSNGGYDMYFQKFDLDGNMLWTKTIGSAADLDWAETISIDAVGNVYLAGAFADTLDFNPNGGGAIQISAGSANSFVAKFDTNGDFIWVKTMQGPGFDNVMSINVSDIGDIFITGMFTDSVDFNPSNIELWAYAVAFEDVYIEKLTNNGDLVWVKTFGGTYSDYVFDAVLDDSQNLYLTGFTRNTADFDPNDGVVEYTSVSSKADGYVLKFAAYTVGLNESNEYNTIKLYPNPTNGNFTINLNENNTKTTIQIVDLTGKIVFENMYNNQTQINLNFQAPKGIYFVKVLSNGQQSIVKLIKQ